MRIRQWRFQRPSDLRWAGIEKSESEIDSLEPLGVREQSLGMQLTVSDAIKDRLEPPAEAALKALGKAFLNKVVAEANSMAASRASLSDMFPKPGPSDVTRAFDREVRREAWRKEARHGVLRYFHHLPVACAAVAMTLLVEFLNQFRKSPREMPFPWEPVIAVLILVAALVVLSILNEFTER
jgi:hypothetical protein